MRPIRGRKMVFTELKFWTSRKLRNCHSASLSSLSRRPYAGAPGRQTPPVWADSAPGLHAGHHSWTRGRATRTPDHFDAHHATPRSLRCRRRRLDASQTPFARPDAKPASPTRCGQPPDYSPPHPLPIKGVDPPSPFTQAPRPPLSPAIGTLSSSS